MDIAAETHSTKIPGHECTLEERFTLEEETIYGDNLLSPPQRFMKFWQRSFLLSRKHPYTKHVFKSTTAFNREVLRHIYINVNIIHPYSYFRSIWEIFMVFFYIATLLFVPFFVFIVFMEVEHRMKYPYALWDDVHVGIFVVTLIDVIVNLHSGYVTSKTKEIVLDRTRISRHYILTFLFVDIVSSFPFEYLVTVLLRHPWREFYWLRYLQLFRVMRIGTLQVYARQMLARFEASLVATKAIIAAIMVLIFVHWVACIYPLHVSEDSGNEGRKNDSYEVFSDFATGDVSWIYMWQLKLTLALCNMFGCNVEHPQRRVKDLLFRTLVSLYGILLMIYIAVQVVTIIKMIRCASIKYEENLAQLQEFIKQKDIPPALEKRLIHYYKFSYPRSYFWEPFTQEFLSLQLKQEIMMHTCKKLLEKAPMFKGLEKDCINKLASFLTHTIVLANDVVLKSGVSPESIFFIAWGSVAVYTDAGKEIRHLRDGDHFGELTLIGRSDKPATNAVAVEDTELYVLSRANFLQAVVSHPQLLKRFPKAKKTRRRTVSSVRREDIRA